MCFSADRECAARIAASVRRHIVDGRGVGGPWTLPAGSFDLLDGLDDDDGGGGGEDGGEAVRRALRDGEGPADYGEVVSALEEEIRSRCRVHDAPAPPRAAGRESAGGADGAAVGSGAPRAGGGSVEHREVTSYAWSEVYTSGSNASFEIEVAIEVPIDALIDASNVRASFGERQFDVSIPTLPARGGPDGDDHDRADRVVYHLSIPKLFRPVDVRRCYHKVSNRLGRVRVFLRKMESTPWRFLRA